MHCHWLLQFTLVKRLRITFFFTYVQQVSLSIWILQIHCCNAYRFESVRPHMLVSSKVTEVDDEMRGYVSTKTMHKGRNKYFRYKHFDEPQTIEQVHRCKYASFPAYRSGSTFTSHTTDSYPTT